MKDVFLFGSVVVTTGLLLENQYPEPDGYGELSQVDLFLGGECGVAAAMLHHFGCSCKLMGFQLGYETDSVVKNYFKNTNVDVSAQTTDPAWRGIRDYVIIDPINHTRTCLGSFEHLHTLEKHHWDMPTEQDVVGSLVAGIDPHMTPEMEEAVRLCDLHNIPYVTYDCPYDSPLHEKSSINVISSCYLKDQYSELVQTDILDLLTRYTRHSKGLTIFTFGSKTIYYGRGDMQSTAQPFQVQVKSTLSAGDSFRTGCIYGLLKGLSDSETVDFASALAGCALTKYPITNNLPELDEVMSLIKSR